MARAIAFFGDLHGHHDRMLQSARDWERRQGARINLIVCAGDFHSVRNEDDRQAMVSPLYRRRPGDFSAYARGEKRFPVEVLFIGGNHEAYNFLDSMPRGGMVATRCRYLGRYGVVSRLGLRIAGLTGIYSPKTYPLGREKIDWADPTLADNVKLKKQATYFVKAEIAALSKMGPADVLVLHEWPRDLGRLAAPGSLQGASGMSFNEPGRQLLAALKPRWLVCAHMHRFFRGDIAWADGRTTTFVCLNQVVSRRDGYMAVLRKPDDGDWQLETV